MKLQKLMYYVQGYYLAAFSEPLFDEEIESWMYGPVVPSVYDYFSKYDADPLPIENDHLKLDSVSERLLRIVFDFLKGFSAIGLMNRTHSESPWQNALPHNRGTQISKDSIKGYFDGQLSSLIKRKVQNDIDFISTLPEGWDHYGSPVPSTESIAKCREIISSLPLKSLVFMEVNPGTNGEVDLVFFNNKSSLGISCYAEFFTWYCQRVPQSEIIGQDNVPYSSLSDVLQLLGEVYS
ncbi:MAG: DUF4065 domain-containing protein [Bacteroidales bacterium]|nr:DUF4065 domain-containing protein [Bacteroidales bacterium]